MGDTEPTVRTRELALALRSAVRKTGMSNMDLARRMGWSAAKVTQLFTAKRRAVETDVSAILALCNIKGAERERLMWLAKQAYGPGWWQDYGDRLPAELRTLIDHEDATTSITNFQTDFVPGLLETTDYTRELLRSSATIPSEEVERRIEARLRRQRILERLPATQFMFFIDEYALRRTGPGREIMSEQIHHLLRLLVRRSVEVRVVPDTAGFHAGQRSFHLMEFAEMNPVVYVETQTSALFLERKDTIATYRRMIEELVRVALTRGQSREWTACLATELGAPWKEHDDHVGAEPAHLEEELVHGKSRLHRISLAPRTVGGA